MKGGFGAIVARRAEQRTARRFKFFQSRSYTVALSHATSSAKEVLRRDGTDVDDNTIVTACRSCRTCCGNCGCVINSSAPVRGRATNKFRTDQYVLKIHRVVSRPPYYYMPTAPLSFTLTSPL